MAEGTVFTNVTPTLLGSDGSSNASFARMALPPEVRGQKSSNTERSKQIEVEARTPSRSPEV
jgi:hypothetical protein